MRTLLLVATLASMAGCRFREPEPSEEVYRAAVADMPPRPADHLAVAQQPEAPAPPAGEDPVVKAQKHPGAPGGFHISQGDQVWAFRPPGDVLVRDGQSVLGVLGGRCLIRSGLVVFPCDAAETRRAQVLLRAAQTVHLRDLRQHAPVTVLGPSSFRVGDPEAAVVVSLGPDGRITSLTHAGEPLMAPVLAQAEPPPPPEAVWDLLGSPEAGATALITVPDQYVVCARTPGPRQVGAAVRELTDWAEGRSARVDERAGVVLEQGHAGWRACLALAEAVPGAQRLSGGPMLRVWHRGAYEGLLARRAALEAEAARRGLTAAAGRGLRAVLYHDPEATQPADRVSALLLPVLQ